MVIESIKDMAELAVKLKIRVVQSGSIRIEMDDSAFESAPVTVELPKSLDTELSEDELTFWSAPQMDAEQPKEGVNGQD